MDGQLAIDFESFEGITPERVLLVLSRDCVGRGKGLTADQLVSRLTLRAATEGLRRSLRQVVQALTEVGYPICRHPSDGYYWAAQPEEVHATIAFLRKRAFTSLVQARQLKNVAIPMVIGQEVLPWGELPLPEVELVDFSQELPISLAMELPVDLEVQIRAWLERHPEMSQAELVQEALRFYLQEDSCE